MLYPTINKLTKGKFNLYQLAVATAKCARLITDEYVRERHIAEKASLGVKDADKTADNIVNPDYRDRKAVKIAIDKIESGEYVIVDRDDEGAMTFGEHSGVFAAAHQAVSYNHRKDNSYDNWCTFLMIKRICCKGGLQVIGAE